MRLLVCILLLSSLVSAQYAHNRTTVIEKGQVLGNTYRSEYFGFEMKIPDGWQPRYVGGSPSLTTLSTTETWGDRILFQAEPKTSGSNELRLISIGISDAPVIRPFDVKQVASTRLKGHETLDGPRQITVNGRQFISADFRRSTGSREYYGRILVALSPEYIVTFLFLETTLERLSALEAASESIQGWFPFRHIQVAQSVMKPASQQQPIYPDEARKAGVSGAVVMQAVIDVNGKVKMLGLVSGHPLLAPAALDAVKDWRYRPYMLNGEPIEIQTQITVNFTWR